MKLHKYPEYKDSGVEWLGEIPSHWELTRLGTRFDERRTKVSDKDYAPLSVTKQGILPQLDNAAKTNDGDNRKLVKAGDFVINSRSDRKGSSGIALSDGSVSLINIVMTPLNIIPTFCNYLLKSNGFIEEYYRMGHGIVADLWTTRYDEMKSILVGIPPLPEQTRIAQFLDQKTALIDKAISIKEKQIGLLKERRQIVIHQAVTRGVPEVRASLGVKPSLKLKDSGVEWIGMIPEHWEVKRLKYFSTVQSGITLGKTYTQKNLQTYPYLRVANVQSGYFNLEEIAEIKIPQNEAKKYFVRKGDILVTEGGDLDKLGRGTMWNGEICNCLHQNHIFAIRVNEAIINSEYASVIMESDYARKYFTQTANKTTNLASTNSTKLGNFPVIIPPLKEQSLVLAYIKTVSNRIIDSISLKEQEIEKLKEYKATLINSVVTGKVKNIIL